MPPAESGRKRRKKTCVRLATAQRGGAERCRIEGAHRGVQRQDHEGDHDVGHADGDAEQVVDELQGRVDRPDRHQCPVDQARPLQQHHPRVGARQQVGPHRQDDDAEEERGPTRRKDREEPGEREGEKQRDEGHQPRDRERVDEHLEVGGRPEHLGKVLEPDDRVRHAAQQQPDHRGHEEHAQEEQGRRRRPEAGRHSPRRRRGQVGGRRGVPRAQRHGPRDIRAGRRCAHFACQSYQRLPISSRWMAQ